MLVLTDGHEEFVGVEVEAGYGGVRGALEVVDQLAGREVPHLDDPVRVARHHPPPVGAVLDHLQ